MSEVILQSALVVWVFMSAWSIYAITQKRNDVADFAWGLGFPTLAIALIQLNASTSVKALVVMILTTIWGIRLSLHIYPRLAQKKEDYRYATWRKQWGKWAIVRSYFQVFMLQGFLMLLVGASILVSILTEETFVWYNLAGVLVWAAGFVFEAVADIQLRTFISSGKKQGSKKVLQSGLWKFSRHPNYFGEVLQWWGLWLVVLGGSYGLFALISPVTITVLIYFVSGIPLLEKRYANDAAYQAYAKKTSKFFPLPPRS